MVRPKGLLGGLLIAALIGCDTTEIACTAVFVYGISVDVISASDGSAVTEDLAGTATDGAFTESMDVFGNTLLGAGERAGTYSVTASATGYASQTADGVVVTADECHVEPVSLSFEMVPLT